MTVAVLNSIDVVVFDGDPGTGLHTNAENIDCDTDDDAAGITKVMMFTVLFFGIASSP